MRKDRNREQDREMKPSIVETGSSTKGPREGEVSRGEDGDREIQNKEGVCSSEREKGIERGGEGGRAIGSQGHIVALAGTERKRTCGNRPEKLWEKRDRWQSGRRPGKGKNQR